MVQLPTALTWSSCSISLLVSSILILPVGLAGIANVTLLSVWYSCSSPIIAFASMLLTEDPGRGEKYSYTKYNISDIYFRFSSPIAASDLHGK